MYCVFQRLAVRLGIASFLPDLRGCHVHLHEDNQAALGAVRALSTRSPSLMRELRRLFLLLEIHDISITATWVPSAQNIADAPSRDFDRHGYCLSVGAFDQINALFGPFTVDRFATASNALCPRFNSPFADPLTEGVDAFTELWAGEANYCYPPSSPAVLLRVAQKLREEGAAAVVIAPCWPAQAFFRELASLASELFHLPVRDLPGDPSCTRHYFTARPPPGSLVAFVVPGSC